MNILHPFVKRPGRRLEEVLRAQALRPVTGVFPRSKEAVL
jgi:hypothetical protein